MSRLPPKPREQLSPDEQKTHDLFRRACDFSFGKNGEKFIFEDSNHGLVGPFPFFISAPKVGQTLHELIYRLAPLPLPPDARETAVLTVGGHFQSGYQLYSHIPVAVEVGLSRDQAEVLSKGEKKPEGLNENCSTAYDVANYLVNERGPLPQVLWDRAVEAFGKDGAVSLLHYVGFYCYVSVALNGVDAGVPE